MIPAGRRMLNLCVACCEERRGGRSTASRPKTKRVPDPPDRQQTSSRGALRPSSWAANCLPHRRSDAARSPYQQASPESGTRPDDQAYLNHCRSRCKGNKPKPSRPQRGAWEVRPEKAGHEAAMASYPPCLLNGPPFVRHVYAANQSRKIAGTGSSNERHCSSSDPLSLRNVEKPRNRGPGFVPVERLAQMKDRS